MSGNVHPNPGPIFPCLVCAKNVTWRGRLVPCCTCFKWVHLKYLLPSFSKFKSLGSSHFWSCPPPCCVSAGDPTPTNTVTSFSDTSSLYTSTVQSGSPLVMQHFRSTSPSKLLSSFLPLCIFSLCTLTTASCPWLTLYITCFLFTP